MHALFITGTDTGVGKTHAACLIALHAAAAGLRVGAYKPVCSGAEIDAHGESIWDDVQRLKSVITVPATVDDICPQRFRAPLAPPLAARLEQRAVDSERMRSGLEAWRDRVDLLLIEGAGGLLCPLTATETIADFAATVNAPLIVVARPGLGTINHTLLTIEAARARRLRVAGIVCCETEPPGDDPSLAGNPAEIERRSGVPVFGTIPFGNDRELLRDENPIAINWPLLAAPVSPRP
jgi:dethiobiotin synthetase